MTVTTRRSAAAAAATVASAPTASSNSSTSSRARTAAAAVTSSTAVVAKKPAPKNAKSATTKSDNAPDLSAPVIAPPTAAVSSVENNGISSNEMMDTSEGSTSSSIVQTLLSEVGLDSFWPSFEAAGLTVPSALVNLQPNVHYAALGIKSASDRRKLFFLVQRLQNEQANNGDGKKPANTPLSPRPATAFSISTSTTTASHPPLSPSSVSSTNPPKISPRHTLLSQQRLQRSNSFSSLTSATSTPPSPPPTSPTYTFSPPSSRSKENHQPKTPQPLSPPLRAKTPSAAAAAYLAAVSPPSSASRQYHAHSSSNNSAASNQTRSPSLQSTASPPVLPNMSVGLSAAAAMSSPANRVAYAAGDTPPRSTPFLPSPPSHRRTPQSSAANNGNPFSLYSSPASAATHSSPAASLSSPMAGPTATSSNSSSTTRTPIYGAVVAQRRPAQYTSPPPTQTTPRRTNCGDPTDGTASLSSLAHVAATSLSPLRPSAATGSTTVASTTVVAAAGNPLPTTALQQSPISIHPVVLVATAAVNDDDTIAVAASLDALLADHDDNDSDDVEKQKYSGSRSNVADVTDEIPPNETVFDLLPPPHHRADGTSTSHYGNDPLRSSLVKSDSDLLDEVLNESLDVPNSAANANVKIKSMARSPNRAMERTAAASTNPRTSGVPPPNKNRQQLLHKQSSTGSIGMKSAGATVTARTNTTANTSQLVRPNPSRSYRTGKPLSTIPDQSVPPPSPLISISLEETNGAPDLMPSKRSGIGGTGRRRSHSLENEIKRKLPMSGLATPSTKETIAKMTSGRNAPVSSTTMIRSGSSRNVAKQPQQRTAAASASHRRASLSKSDSDRSFGSTSSAGSSTSRRRSMVADGVIANRRQPRGNGASETDERGTADRDSIASGSTTSTRSVSGAATGGISWKAQIEALRSETAAEHELFGGTEVLDSYCTDGVVEASDNANTRIRVVVRKRPLSTSERMGDVDVIHPLTCGSYGRILVYQPKTRVDLTKHIETTPFAFDDVFDEATTNADIYERTVRNLIPPLLDDGQWASVFAYGQTGSGKTYTMMGDSFTGMNDTAKATQSINVANLGLYYMAALDLFHATRTTGYEDFSIRVSLFEIYGGKLFDLLSDRAAVKCLEDSKGNVCFPGLSEHCVSDSNELMNKITQGAALRSTGITSRNADSSRSHAVLQLHLYKPHRPITKQRVSLVNRQSVGNNMQSNVKEWSRLTFIDLAGSERGADTSQASRATRLEGAEINTSLLALKEVIRALASGDSLAHVPFRGSKLTQVLKQSFVGKNCRSVMIACISPNMSSCEQTLNTLRYADRVKERNPETGELAPGIVTKAVTPKGKVADFIRNSQASSSSLTASSGAIPGMRDGVTNRSQSSVHSEMLDELLASPPSGASDDEDMFAGSSVDGTLPDEKYKKQLRDAADVLLATHVDARAFMLEMVKEEMTLVSDVDANREGMDDYMVRLHAIQDEQLAMITVLREQLLQYRLLSQRMHLRGEQYLYLERLDTVKASPDDDDDDSFEDLRS